MGDLAKPALTLRIQEKMDQLKKGKFGFNKEDLNIIKYLLKNKNLNQGGTVMKTKKYRGGGQGYAAREDESLGMRTGAERTKRQSMRDRRDESYGAWGRRPNQMINRQDGGLGARAISDEDKRMVKLLLGEGSKNISDEDKRMVKLLLGEGSKNISADDRARAKEIVDDFRKESSESHNAKGGVASFARGGVEAADKEGSRLSVSMESQEDAGFSPSQADFDQQHRLAEEGIMDVGTAVTIVQGHDSREQLGETDGVRGGGAAIRGKNFHGVS
jgi:hypothetical protein